MIENGVAIQSAYMIAIDKNLVSSQRISVAAVSNNLSLEVASGMGSLIDSRHRSSAALHTYGSRFD